MIEPKGLSPRTVARIRKITGVRNVLAFDGGEIKADGRPASVIGVNPGQFRSWTPLRTASDQAFWTALADGRFVAAGSARTRLGLRRGASYQLAGASKQSVTFGRAASLGVSGVDLVVNARTSRALGLVHSVAALISAPGAGLAALTSEVRAVAGRGARIVSLRSEQLPVSRAASGQLPGSYLALFKQSAATYCPGMSWTVLAAIGQIESADGTNVGPSTAGALGPMQFLPSTWSEWGITGFGQSGPPDVMNPYDAVPSAARMLCADGAAGGGHALYQAIFDYNHAAWYVNEVLGLAGEYASGLSLTTAAGPPGWIEACRRTTRSCSSPSGARRVPRMSSRSCGMSPAVALCRRSGLSTWPSTTTGSAGSARSTSSAGICSA